MAARQPPTSAYALANNTGQGMRARSRGSAKAATLIRVSCVARGNPRDRCDRSVSCGLSLRRWRAACTYDERGASCVLLTETAASAGEAAVSPLGGEVASARRDKRGGFGTLPCCSAHQHDLSHRPPSSRTTGLCRHLAQRRYSVSHWARRRTVRWSGAAPCREGSRAASPRRRQEEGRPTGREAAQGR